MLADTSFIIDVMLNERGAVEKAKELTDASVPLAVGTPTVFELYIGVGLSVRSSEEREKILSVLKSLTQLPLDMPSATRAGLVYAGKVRDGSKIDPADAMLAGIAIENRQHILTRNKSDFSGIPDLTVESY
jgi:predicted nucleic acid-binding protein